MSYEIETNIPAEKVRETLRKMFASARKSGTMVSHIRKNTWEFETSEDAKVVSDNEGILKVIKVTKKLKRSLY
jgi:hypothetical protein